MLKRISRTNRYIILGISLSMILVYFVPIWYIGLTAPQYQDGLSMHIWVSEITGGSEHDLRNINLLNHYVGMDEIHAESIPEFRYMPYVLGFMILGGLVAFLWPRMIMVYLGLINFALTAIAGMYDFWHWLYDYGHNLDPTAPLQIADSFQPPLIACKELLNFTACSWPNVGTFILLIAAGALGYIVWKELHRNKEQQHAP